MKLGNDPPSQLVLTPLERSVLKAVGRRLGDAGRLLEAQCDSLRVSSRTHSGVGFVTRLEVPEGVGGLPDDVEPRVGTLYASHPALDHGAEFLVQLKGGRVASIEAFCPEGMWPADEAGFRVGVTAAR